MAGPVKTVTLRLQADSAEAQKKLDAVQRQAEELGRLNPEIKPKIDKAAVTAQLAILRADMKATGKQSGDLSAAIGDIGKAGAGAAPGLGGMGAAMGGVLAAGVALSPIVATIGTGLAGLGIGAYAAISPIAKAAKAAGGLQANLGKLDPAQQAAAISAISLEKSYHAFSKSLEPEVLDGFNKAMRIGGNLLHDIQPVAAATGKEFDSFLGAFGRDLQDPQWTQFWQFMAKTAPGDMHALGQTFIDLANDLPQLLEQLQPVGQALLTITDDAAKATGGILKFTNALTTQDPKAAGGGGGLIGWIEGSYIKTVRSAENATADLFKWIPGLHERLGQGAAPADRFGKSLDHVGTAAAKAAPKLKTMAQRVTDLMNAQTAALNTELNYSNALIGAAGDAKALQAALKASGHQIGLHTAAQLASFSAANQYIADLENAAKQSIASGHGAAGAARQISAGLPILDSARTKNKLYWQEVRTLHGWLHKLQQMAAITERIRITGTGYWQATSGVLPGQPGKHFVGRFAGGGKVPGWGGGDRWPVLVEGGETIFPKQLTPLVAPIAKAYGLPGFAAGGKVPALETWAMRAADFSRVSTANAVGDALAKSFAAAFSQSGFGGSGGVGGGVIRWAPDILRALAMLGQSSANLAAVEHRIAQESGGNPWAINRWDVNAQMGDPSRGLMQTIGATFAAYRSFALPDNIYNPLSNIFAGLNYALHAYPGRTLASVMLQPGGYDGGGYLPPGLSLAYNGTGKPEPVGPAARTGPAVVVNIGTMPIRETADLNILSQRIGFLIASSGLG